MRFLQYFSIFIGLVFFIEFCCTTPNREYVSQPATLTKIYNKSKDTALVYITLGATSGCLQNIVDIPFIQKAVPGQNNLQGTFILNPGDSTEEYAPDALGFNGVISFNFPPDNCPSDKYPNGLNQYEFMLNNDFQGKNAQESINISCVHGVNCVIRVSILSRYNFNAGQTYPVIKSFANTMDRSFLTAGVYPYGCDTCTGSKNPPTCIQLPQPKQKESICQVQRNASKSGGLIKVIYLGTEEPLKIK